MRNLFGICITAPTRGPISSSGFPATGLKTKFLRTAEEPAGRHRPGWDPGLCLASPKLPPPWASPGGDEQGARGLRGVPLCFSTPPHSPPTPPLQQEHLHRVMEEPKGFHASSIPRSAAHSLQCRLLPAGQHMLLDKVQKGIPWTPLHFRLK